MPDPQRPCRLASKPEIRRRLNADREWALFALADLDDGMFQHCDWWALGDSLALVFRALSIRPIVVLGDGAATRCLLSSLPETSGYLNLQPHQLEAAEKVYRFRERHEMARMFVRTFTPRGGATEPLGPGACQELERLYATGDGGGIAFAPFQLETGLFRGIRQDGELAAVAGVHVFSKNEGVAAVGNVFTRPDCRGRGLAQTVTSAVVQALLDAGIQTIGLNVESANLPAIRAYERIGFRTAFHYYDGPADRIPPY
jgi:ribosomal protein S18 acetylase RimI-like enzyme